MSEPKNGIEIETDRDGNGWRLIRNGTEVASGWVAGPRWCARVQAESAAEQYDAAGVAGPEGEG